MDSQKAGVATTVVLLRDQPSGFQVLLLHRPADARMFPDAWVFPGGAVDATDGSGAAGVRAAAIREVEEESGSRILADDLVPLAYWEPPGPARRFNTTFFVARSGDEHVRVDGLEMDDHMWVTPRAALDRQRSGSMVLAIPTWMTLNSLASHATSDDVIRHAKEDGVRTFRTHIVHVPDGRVALWDGDAGYESRDLDAFGARFRLFIPKSAPWHLERSPG